MRRLLGGRRWSAAVTVAAVGALLIGSWFVVSAVTVPPTHAIVTTVVQPKTESRSPASKPPDASSQITVPPTTQPVVQNPVAPTSTLAPSTPTTLATAASPTPVAPARNTTASPTKPPIPKTRTSQS